MILTIDLPFALVLCAGMMCALGWYAVRAWDRAQRLAASVDLTLGGAPDGVGGQIADAVSGGAVAMVAYDDDDDDGPDVIPPIGYTHG